MVNRCVRKSFGIRSRCDSRNNDRRPARCSPKAPGRTPSAFVTPWGRSNARGSSPWHAEPAAPNLPTPPKEITLLDIHQAVESTNLDDVIGIHERGNHTCPRGSEYPRRSQRCVCSMAPRAMSDSVREVTLAEYACRLPEIALGSKPGNWNGPVGTREREPPYSLIHINR